MNDESNTVRILHLEEDVKELKLDNKEMTKSMETIKENHVETKFYIKRIEENQITISNGFVNLQKSMETIAAKPAADYEKAKWIALTALIAFIISNVVGFIKVFFYAPK
ncbi:MAG TPA: hypothetical protein VFD03_06060 [Clostridia bacterium]|nr:hypothetical protein [Clostridia bacterium]